ncbi:hypothetical protein METBIDRAFT_11652 [Metschnikowia bicuspidata var. bicuspidata NRRL YB-4993]|uniref:Uncharacterized protein n=1 Tax=Metschnikowia bicuspidata var. bicuspidata NRRL YB-4993 TaxID=869754 RepID=A0A1A0HAN5_9ASCO|nr:hypothetical protein METBIDRAFT_11652 [Metschnikowia bicuspidata var. bicuspidata NRRL YB-4993]OBA21076.1 hypothetical protein METBIDRAFT_11652 [Metschnikowia bicuspidata var. bicuspidata NRRL YB-4993]
MGKGGKGSSGGGHSAGYPSTTGNPSGGGRDNGPRSGNLLQLPAWFFNWPQERVRVWNYVEIIPWFGPFQCRDTLQNYDRLFEQTPNNLAQRKQMFVVQRELFGASLDGSLLNIQKWTHAGYLQVFESSI